MVGDRVMTEEKNYDEMTFHELRKACVDAEIKYKNTDKKKDLLTMLKAGKTVHVEKPKQPAPKLEARQEKTKPTLPDDPRLDELRKRGLTWEINEEECTVTFKRDIEVCANLDQSANNIYNSARAAFGGLSPVRTGVYGAKDKFEGFNGQ